MSSHAANDSSSDSTSSFPLSDHQYSLQGRRVGYIFARWRRGLSIKFSRLDTSQKRRHIRRLVWSSSVILLFALLAVLYIVPLYHLIWDSELTKNGRLWLVLIVTVANRLRIPHLQNGLWQILQTYHAPDSTHPGNPTWVEHFSDGIKPVQCHSHNDYWHRIPLFEGLYAGCISTEADIFVGNTPDDHVDLFVGHNHQSLSQSRTLRSLYLTPLMDILTHQNSISANVSSTLSDPTDFSNATFKGIFSTAPDLSFILVLDFKTGDNLTWDTVVSQLDDLRARGWLTHWTPQDGIVQRPLTIVASGEVLFEYIISNATYRDIFYDAPLTKLSNINSPYNSNNSFYASASLRDAIGTVMFGRLNTKQKSTIANQIGEASKMDLKSRYWDTPSWPVGWRNRIWDTLVELGESVLNADDLMAASRWDWNMCVVAGVNICNT